MRTADAELFKEKIEVTLDGRQIFYLFFGGAVIASLVFVLGVVVGRRVEAESHLSRASSAAMDPLSALDQLEAAKPGRPSLTSTLAAGAGDRSRPFGVANDSSGTATGNGHPSGGASARSAADGAKPATAAAGTAKAAAGTAKAAGTATAAEGTQAQPSSSAAQQASTPAPGASDSGGGGAAGAKPKSKSKTTAAANAKFTLQLSSFEDRAEAESFYDQLESNGYEPYIIEAQVPKKGAYWRVRLGKYASYAGAIAAKKKFEARMHIIAYVTHL